MNSPRVMVFYDGSYFKQGNVFFRYREERGWFNLAELHAALEAYVAEKANARDGAAKVVGAHFYDGRASTNVLSPDALRKERDFEMALLRAGIAPHYLAVRETPRAGGSQDEHRFTLSQKGVDVQLAIDMLDFAHTDRFDVAVLIAGDEDFVPLVRRIESLGRRVLLAHFEIDAWTDRNGNSHRSTFTSRALQEAASWTLNFNEFVRDPARKAASSRLFFVPNG